MGVGLLERVPESKSIKKTTVGERSGKELEPAANTRIHVRDVMSGPPVTASLKATVLEIARKMVESKVGSVVIIDGDTPVGIVTDGDIVQRVVVKDLKPSKVKTGDMMSQPVHMIDADKEITEAARTMRKLRIKRLGVLRNNHLVGIISMSDIMSVTPDLMELLSEKGRIMTGETLRSRTKVTGYCDSCNQWSDFLTESDAKYLCEECVVEVKREA